MTEYKIYPVKTPFLVDADWNKPVWNNIPELTLNHYMGREPLHRPQTRVKLLYDESRIYLIFRVEDRFIKAAIFESQGPVCRDSCVEFFFTPGALNEGYFNFEINCCGIYLFHYQKARHIDMVLVEEQDCSRIQIAHTISGPINKEIQKPTDWVIELMMPLDFFRKYYSNYLPPVKGTIWRSNFYKCADETSHPHWLTWSPVDFPEPDFHRPKSFGHLLFM